MSKLSSIQMLKHDTNEPIYKTEICRKQTWLLRERGGEDKLAD